MKIWIHFLKKKKKKDEKREKEKVCSSTNRPQTHNHFQQSYSCLSKFKKCTYMYT